VHATHQPGAHHRAARAATGIRWRRWWRRWRFHVRPRLDPGARRATPAPKLHRRHREANRISDVAAVRPRQASKFLLQTRPGLAAVPLEVYAPFRPQPPPAIQYPLVQPPTHTHTHTGAVIILSVAPLANFIVWRLFWFHFVVIIFKTLLYVLYSYVLIKILLYFSNYRIII